MPRVDRIIAQGGMAAVASNFIWTFRPAVLANVMLNPFIILFFVSLGCGLASWTVARLKSQKLLESVRAIGKKKLLIAIGLDIVSGYLIYVALQLAPIGAVIAIGSSAPIWLSLFEICTRRRQITAKTVASLLLVASGLILLGTTQEGQSQSVIILGLACSLLAAISIAWCTKISKDIVNNVQAFPFAAGCCFMCCIIMSPTLLVYDIQQTDALWVMVVGIATLPATALYWVALRRLPAVSMANIKLLQPFFGSLLAYALYSAPINLVQNLFVLVFVAGICLDLMEVTSTKSHISRPREVAP